MGLFTVGKKLAQAADGLFDDALVQSKQVGGGSSYEEDLAAAIKADADDWDEAAFIAEHPRPEKSAPEREKVRWRNLKNKTKKKRELAVKRKAYVDDNSDAIKEQRRKYAAANRDKIAEREKRYRAENIDRIKKKQKATKARNAEAIAEQARGYRERNKEKVLARQRAWREANRDKIREYNALKGPERKAALARLKQEDPDAYEAFKLERKAKAAERRAAVRARTPAWSNQEDILGVYRRAQELTQATGTPYEVDHVIPLRGRDDTASGLHVRDNLLIVPRNINRSKSNSFSPGDDPMRMNEVARRRLLEQAEEGLLGPIKRR